MQHTSRLVCAKDAKEENSVLHHSEEPAGFCVFTSETWNYLSPWKNLLCTCQAWGPSRVVGPLHIAPQLCSSTTLF